MLVAVRRWFVSTRVERAKSHRVSPGESSDARRSRAIGFLLVVFAALTWSTAGIGIKVLWADALSVAGYRSLFALPVVIAFAAATADRPALTAAMKRPLVWAAALSYALTVTVFVAATKLTTAANAILLQYTAPIHVALLSYPLLGERLRRSDVRDDGEPPRARVRCGVRAAAGSAAPVVVARGRSGRVARVADRGDRPR
jgi:hypothetical protein